MNHKLLPVSLALTLGFAPASAHAQYIPPWLVVGALSPILVLVLCVILGWLARNALLGARHAMLAIVWVVLFALASYFIENDYVIWTPLVLYLLHSALLLGLIGVQIYLRLSGKEPDRTRPQKAASGP